MWPSAVFPQHLSVRWTSWGGLFILREWDDRRKYFTSSINHVTHILEINTSLKKKFFMGQGLKISHIRGTFVPFPNQKYINQFFF